MKTIEPRKDMSRHMVFFALVTAAILLVPLVAMQFTSEVNWSPADFIAIGALLLGTGFIYELISLKVRSKKGRIVVGVSLLVLLALIWIELAVGIFN